MSNAKTYQGDRAAIVTHAHPEGFNLCNGGNHTPNPFRPATPRHAVTCKRCLASLAKRDRAFRAKARAHYARTGPASWVRDMDRGVAPYQRAVDVAARAIAAEEGRP